jgi:hypothetical protein
MENEKSNFWFALDYEGELWAVGDHGDFQAAEITAEDMGISILWLLDEPMARQWLGRLQDNLSPS